MEGLKNVQLEPEDYQIAEDLVSKIGSFSGKEADLVSIFQKITESYFLNLKCVSEPIRSSQNSEAKTDLSIIKEDFMLLNFEAKRIETGIIIQIIIFFLLIVFFFHLRKKFLICKKKIQKK